MNVDVLFNDEVLVVAGAKSHWARRRKIDLAELVNESWILPSVNTLNSVFETEWLRERGFDAPKIRLVTFSVQLRMHLLGSGEYITFFPLSMMRILAERMALKVLPVKLPIREWPVVMVTLKNRTQNPVAQLFIRYLREGRNRSELK